MNNNKICRICLQSDAYLKKVTNVSSEALKIIFDIETKHETNDYLICKLCESDLLTFHKFYLKVRESQKMFVENLVNIKEESEDSVSNHSLELPEIEAVKCENTEMEEESEKPKRKNVSKKYSCKKNHLCPTCGKYYSDLYYLRRHIKEHDLPRKKKKFTQLICDLCGLRKNDRNKMRSHIETVHLKIKDATCHICGAEFHRTTIGSHIKKMHRDDKKREKCDECGKFFLDLKQHKARNHNEQEAVSCNLCKKPFKNRMLLALHRFKRHPPDGKYDCRDCGKKFTNPVGLKEHTFAYHAGVFLYNCEFCNYRGSYKKNLFDHWKRNHREYYDQRRQLFQSRHDTEIPPQIQ